MIPRPVANQENSFPMSISEHLGPKIPKLYKVPNASGKTQPKQSRRGNKNNDES